MQQSRIAITAEEMSATGPQHAQPTWKDVVFEALNSIGRPARPKEISDLIEGHPKCRTNPTWRATVRRTLQQYSVFESLKDGRWRLRAPPELQRVEATRLNHIRAQGYLLEIGKLYGFETYTPDRSRPFGEVRLGEVATLQRMPSFTYARIVKEAARIDVLWFQGGTDELVPRYAFEVEQSTGIGPGLHRLFQLFQVRGRETKLFVVVPDRLGSRFESQVAREPYRAIRDQLFHRSYSELAALYEAAIHHAPLKQQFLGG